MAALLTVEAFDNPFIGALRTAVALLANENHQQKQWEEESVDPVTWNYSPAVKALLGTLRSIFFGAVLRKVSLARTLTTLGVRSRNTRVLAVGGHVPFFTAVVAATTRLARIGAIALTVAGRVTVHTFRSLVVQCVRIEVLGLAGRVARMPLLYIDQ